MVRPSSAGTATLSTAVRFDSRLGNWKMKPMWRQRKSANSASGSIQISAPSNKTLPSVGLVRAPSIAISVDLPEPDRPTIDTNSPRRSSRLACRTASYPGPLPYRLVSAWACSVTSPAFHLDECIRCHAAHAPCRQQRPDDAEDRREHDRRECADLK